MSAQPGLMLSHYRLVEKIGEGGMGVVWKAEDTVLNRTVAIKVLPSERVLEEHRQRFLDEARLAASLSDAHIVQVHELGRERDLDFIVMEYVEGKPLHKILHGRPLPPDKVADWGQQIAQGLARAHRKGLLHRDLKPANVIVTTDGDAKVVDFGLATLFSPPDPSSGSPTVALSEAPEGKPSSIVGTLPYMSPEQVRGEKLDPRSDIFSLGTVLYEMTTGQRPFTGARPAEIAQEILKSQRTPVHELVPKVPLDLHRIIEKALARRPEERYQAMDDLAVDLKRLARDLESGSSPSYEDLRQVAAPRRRRWLLVLATGLAGVVVASALWVLVTRNQARRTSVAPEGNSLAVFAFENLHDPADPQRLGQILQELMIADLSSLEPFKVLSSQRLYDIQRQLDQQATRADKNLTTSVASQAGAQRMLIGSLGQLADRWIVTCQLVEVQSGTVIESKRLDGTDLYSMVDKLSDEIRGDLALRVPAEFAGKSVGEKTSTSLEAWRHYLGGTDHLNNNRYAQAVQELEKAVEIDPSFGQAYYKLAVAQGWLGGGHGSARDPIVHLLERRLYASPQEKEMAEALLLQEDGKGGEAKAAFAKLTREYPYEKLAWYGLGESQYHYGGVSNPGESLPSFERAVALDPDFLLPYRHIFDVLWNTRRIEDAIDRAEKLVAREPTRPLWHRYRAGSVAFTGDVLRTRAVLADAEKLATTAEDRRELYTDVAFAWTQIGYLPLAEEYLHRALQADPEHSQTPEGRLGNLLLLERRLDEYEKRVRALLAKDADNDTYLDALADVLVQEHRYDEVLRMARERTEKEPDDPRWYRWCVMATILKGGEEDLPDVLARAESHNQSPDDRRALFEAMAQAYAYCGYRNRAIEHFEKALASSSEPNAAIQWAMGVQEQYRGRYGDAEAWLRKVILLAPDNRGPRYSVALLQIERGDLDGARATIDELRKLLSPPPNMASLRFASMTILTHDDHDIDKLFSPELDFLIGPWNKRSFLYSLTPFAPYPLPGIGWAYLYAGRFEEARATFESGTKLEMSRDSSAHRGLGFAQLNLGDYSRAERAFTSGLGSGYDKAPLLHGIGIARLLQGDGARAEKYARQALQEAPHIAGWQLLGWALAAQRRWRDALPVAEKAVDLDSSRASLELLAWVLVDGDLDLKRGIEVAKQARELPISFFDLEKSLPHRASAEHSLGLAFLKQGKYGEAVEWLEKAAALQPKRESVRADLRRARDLAARP